MSRVVPKSRPVHPCLLSVFDGNTGAEFSTWAHVTTKKDALPNLVTAQGSSLRIYTVDDASGKLALVHSFTNLAGSVCFLDSLHVKDEGVPDSLLIGFAGHPRVAVVSVTAPTTLSANPIILEATTLIDLTQALIENSLGSITPLEQDLMATLEQKSTYAATLTVILGGGIAVACISLQHVHGRNGSGWTASEPYLLPLATLRRTAERASESAAPTSSSSAHATISHGMGDIVSACFLSGYLEPTLVLLHSNKEHGRGCSGRLGRPEGEGGTQYGMIVTAISLTVVHRRSAVLWSVEVPADAISLHSVGEKGVLVKSINSLLEINNAGRIAGPVLSVNGWVQSTCPNSLLEKLQPNPWPLPKLAIQLDGARISFISDELAFLCLRQGQLYLLQRVGDTWSAMALGTTLGGIGQVSSLLTLALADVPKAMVSKLVTMDKQELSLEMLSMGLLFAGSRLGDSSLLGYTLEANVTFTDKIKQEGGNGKKQKVEQDVEDNTTETPHAIDEHELILQKEEEALYAPTEDDECPDVIPASSDEEVDDAMDTSLTSGVTVKKRSRPRLAKLTVVRSATAMDTITALGPVGPWL
jgi:cleavage and polyadenylation specificity factor subunit 1